MRNVIYFCLCLLVYNNFLFAQLYIAPDGNDGNPGTKEQPYGTFSKTISEVTPGDTIYVRGGLYNLTSTITISAAKSGTESAPIILTAFKNEIPVLDFSYQSFGAKGVSLRSNFWRIKGLQIKGAGDNGMEINFGSNNIIEYCSFYENRDTGLQLSNGSANNKIINCDSYYNADPPDYGDADGFAPKLTVGNGNYFYGCRAWVNSDDGWDGYLRGANDVTTTLENCWTWGNGYLKDGTDPGSQANGNGFKMGGGDKSNSELLMHHHVLINCVSFYNKSKGFDQNNNVGSMTLLNCTGYHNLAANYKVQRTLNPGQILTVKNCVSFAGNVQLGSFAVQETNSWLAPFIVTSDDFLSLSTELASMSRQINGSLPEIEFLHLIQGSDLIDAGVDLGFPYKGPAPDLGAFESDYMTSVVENIAPYPYHLYQNFPNPFNPETTIQFILPKSDKVKISVFDHRGKLVDTLINTMLDKGVHTISFNATNHSSGVYYCKIEVADYTQMRKMLLLK